MTDDNCISRQAVLDYIRRILNQGTGKKKSFEFIQKYVENLPSVTPKEKTGWWMRRTRVENVYDIAGVKSWGIKCQCDRCGFAATVIEDFGYYKYCPNCGARMVSE